VFPGLRLAFVVLPDAAAGLHLAATFPGREFTQAVLEEALARGVKLYAANMHAANGTDWSDTLLFGYGMLPVERIEQGIGVLREVMG
jgi:DNA-binding transcriptional MocR family regulator